MEGRCVLCGRESEGGTGTCKRCREMDRRRKRKRKESGLCSTCGRPLSEGDVGRVTCLNCREGRRRR